jgi:hypothetical protein
MGTVSCIVSRTGNRSVKDNDNTTITPQIIFLNYSIKKDKSKGEFEIRLIDKYITEGKLKMNNQEPEISKPGDLMCVSLNNHLEPVDSITVSDPLNITVESVDANNALFKKEIVRDSAQFSIRMQLEKRTVAIAIKKSMNSENHNSYLLITKIK